MLGQTRRELGVFAGAARRDCVRKVRAQMEHSPISGVIADLSKPDHPVIACNSAFEQMTGYSRDEVLQRNCRFMNRGNLPAGVSRSFERAIAEGKPFSIEVENYRKDGKPFLNGISLSPIFGRNGDLVAMLGSLVDLTDYDPLCHLQAYHLARAKLTRLSERQFEVLCMMAEGKLIKEIAFALDIADRTVKLHRAGMVKALGTKNSVEAIRVAIEAGY